MHEGESSTLDRVHSYVSRLRQAVLAATVFARIKLAQVSSSLVFALNDVLTPLVEVGHRFCMVGEWFGG